MYKINRQGNSITALKACSFSELEFRERAHLQEWIAKEPKVLGEELLIIQKEFSGFSDTNERLDLLAIDKQGSLVIIENKLDDAGRDVTWQALKYASYCASLSSENIRRIYQQFLSRSAPDCSPNLAEENLCEFLGVEDFQDLSLNKGVTQRIILVAARFRKEVTSTVLWLMNFKVRLQCFRATPYAQGDDLFLSIEQIIPTRDAEEFMISLASKAQDEVAGIEVQSARQADRRRFWNQLLASMNARSDLFRSISPQTQSWLSAGSGIRGVGFNFGATASYARVELYIDRGDKTENELIFQRLQDQRDSIEADFGNSMVWERLDTKRACRIKVERNDNVFNQDQWPSTIEYLVETMVSFEAALRGPLGKIRETIRSTS
ncbi:DUF4268 domain-containing protein [Roseomonas sp. USHLN139]|uniref:DUF4268 domain-containing protein n=1 Tax=Roseomonas sp. USHLN139 TaxID=3081298 RepID=UPI003B02891D